MSVFTYMQVGPIPLILISRAKHYQMAIYWSVVAYIQIIGLRSTLPPIFEIEGNVKFLSCNLMHFTPEILDWGQIFTRYYGVKIAQPFYRREASMFSMKTQNCPELQLIHSMYYIYVYMSQYVYMRHVCAPINRYFIWSMLLWA